MKIKNPESEKLIYYSLTFRFDKETSEHLESIANMFPYVANKSVIVRELINSAYDQAVLEGLIRSD